MRFLATTATLLTSAFGLVCLAGCGAHPAAPVAVKRAAPAPQAQAATTRDAGWGINDGLIMNDDERRVFAALPKALKPTPTTSNLYRNLVSNFNVRTGKGQRFWTFSGTRYIAESLFVPHNPSFEYFFSGVFDTETGEAQAYCEVEMKPSK